MIKKKKRHYKAAAGQTGKTYDGVSFAAYTADSWLERWREVMYRWGRADCRGRASLLLIPFLLQGQACCAEKVTHSRWEEAWCHNPTLTVLCFALWFKTDQTSESSSRFTDEEKVLAPTAQLWTTQEWKYLLPTTLFLVCTLWYENSLRPPDFTYNFWLWMLIDPPSYTFWLHVHNLDHFDRTDINSSYWTTDC